MGPELRQEKPTKASEIHTLLWRMEFRMELILAESGVSEYIKKETNKGLLTGEERKVAEKEDNKAKSLIVQYVKDTQLESLRNKEAAFKGVAFNTERTCFRCGKPGHFKRERRSAFPKFQGALREGKRNDNTEGSAELSKYLPAPSRGSHTAGKMSRQPFKTRSKSSRLLEIMHTDICRTITPVRHKLLENNGLIIDYTMPHTPQQNGKVDRINSSLVERASTMINDAGVPKEMWGEVIRTTTYILNRSPTDTLSSNATPAAVWNKRKPNVGNLKVFGSLACSHLQKEHRDKFDSKMEKYVMMVYTPNGYRLWRIDRNKLIIARDVKFNEDVPKTYYDLEHRLHIVLWEGPMKRELDSINKNNTWEIIEKPKDTKMLDTKWVYALKPLEQDDSNKYKARLVARGFAQDKEDCNNLYSPIPKMTIAWLLNVFNVSFLDMDMDEDSSRNNFKSHKQTFLKKDHSLKKRQPHKPETGTNVIYVSTKSDIKGLKQKCDTLLRQNEEEIVIYCLGAAIQRGIILALQLCDKYPPYKITTNTLTTELIDDLEPAADDADYEIQKSMIH
ncbi:form3 [Trypoxylus dichotomus]